MKYKVDFLSTVKHQRFLQIDTVIFGTWGRHASITQNNQVRIPLQYIKKEVSDQIDFLCLDKLENSLQIDTMIFDGDGQTFLKFPKW